MRQWEEHSGNVLSLVFSFFVCVIWTLENVLAVLIDLFFLSPFFFSFLISFLFVGITISGAFYQKWKAKDLCISLRRCPKTLFS